MSIKHHQVDLDDYRRAPNAYYHKRNCWICAITPHNSYDCKRTPIHFVRESKTNVICEKCAGETEEWKKYSCLYQCRLTEHDPKCPKCGTKNTNTTYQMWEKQCVHPCPSF